MVTLWRSIRITIVFAVILGILYPLAVTGVGNLLFPNQAQGSMVTDNGQVVGSKLIAQDVMSPSLFHYRPSAVNYAANGSGGSNLGPTNPALIQEIQGNLKSDGVVPSVNVAPIPTDMVESSGSGLDPDISITDAKLQVTRISHASGLSEATLHNLITQDQTGPFLGLWGEPMVNVMQLNLDLLNLEKTK